MKIAFWTTKNASSAEDLVQGGIVRVLDPDDKPWDPAVGTFLTHMTYLLRRIWTDRLRRRSDAHKALVVAELLVERLTICLHEQQPLAAR